MEIHPARQSEPLFICHGLANVVTVALRRHHRHYDLPMFLLARRRLLYRDTYRRGFRHSTSTRTEILRYDAFASGRIFIRRYADIHTHCIEARAAEYLYIFQ
jgi:hypothetical protein